MLWKFHEFTVSSLGVALLLARAFQPLDTGWGSHTHGLQAHWQHLGLGPSRLGDIRWEWYVPLSHVTSVSHADSAANTPRQ